MLLRFSEEPLLKVDVLVVVSNKSLPYTILLVRYPLRSSHSFNAWSSRFLDM